MDKILVLMTDGTEEMEAVIIVDTLRRAKLDVQAIGLSALEVTCSRDVVIHADNILSDIDVNSFDVLVLPGGAGGAQTMSDSPDVISVVKAFRAAGKLVCAICAGPLVLQAAGELTGKRFTCHPSVKDDFRESEYTGARLEMDDNILTSQGPGTAFEFALRIIDILKGAATAAIVRDGLVL
jgi:DJ-1 family protein